MPEDEIKKFFNEKLSDFKSFCFSFTLGINIDILRDGVDFW